MSSFINLNKLSKNGYAIGFFVDVVMIFLVLINISWIIFDWHFSFSFVKEFWILVDKDFFDFYNNKVHPYFLLFDAFFVAIFITELLVRWAIAINNKTYGKWFFYPFVHWYDVLGCIPLGTFRFLRILRIVSMTLRLHKLGVINLRNTFLYKQYKKYSEIIVEEISDRVVVNVLSGIQDEVAHGNPIADKMVLEVIMPHKEVLVQWVSHRVSKVTSHQYDMHREELRSYIAQKVSESIRNSQDVGRLQSLPLVGNVILSTLENSISEITFNVIDAMMNDLSSDANSTVISEIADAAFEAILLPEEDRRLNAIAEKIVIDAIEVVKGQVKVQQWKEKQSKEKNKNHA